MTQELGRYILLTRLATGGMAEIFLAQRAGEAGFQKTVVVKRILPHMADSPELLEMFHNEARLAAKIAHSNVCQIYELGEQRGQHFIAMEYLEGVTFARVRTDLARRPRSPIDLRLAASLVAQACEGLHHAHELSGDDGRSLGLVHRDVSPQNLMVTTDGGVKVLDFGIAKVHDAAVRTHSGVLKGKFQYMSPEQIAGRPVDRRSDLFALGAVLFELVTRQPLFDRPNVLDVTRAIAEQPIPRLRTARPDVPPALDQLVARALSRDPDGRPPTARALAEELGAAVAALGGFLPVREVADEVNDLCAEFIAQRREVVDRALATGEEDAEIAGPVVPTERIAPSAMPTTIEARPLGSRQGPRRFLPLVIAAPVLAAGILWLALGSGDDDAGAEVPVDAAHVARQPPPEMADAAVPVPVAAADAAPPAAPVAPPVRRKSERPGYFSIDSEPYATIYVDGKRMGDTPLFKVELAAGRHQVRAVCSCGKSRKFAVKIREGETHRARRLVW